MLITCWRINTVRYLGSRTQISPSAFALRGKSNQASFLSLPLAIGAVTQKRRTKWRRIDRCRQRTGKNITCHEQNWQNAGVQIASRLTTKERRKKNPSPTSSNRTTTSTRILPPQMAFTDLACVPRRTAMYSLGGNTLFYWVNKTVLKAEITTLNSPAVTFAVF